MDMNLLSIKIVDFDLAVCLASTRSNGTAGFANDLCGTPSCKFFRARHDSASQQTGHKLAPSDVAPEVLHDNGSR